MLMVRLPCEAACVMGGEDILRAQATPTTGMKETEPAMTRRADGGSRGPRQPLRWVNAQQTTKRRRTVFVTGDANIHETSFKLSRKTAAFKYYDDSLILPKEMKRRSHLFAVPLPQPVPADPVMAPIDDVQLYPCTMAVIFRPHPHAPSPTVRAHARRTAAYSNQHVGVLDTKTTPLLFLSSVMCCCVPFSMLDSISWSCVMTHGLLIYYKFGVAFLKVYLQHLI